jgi:VWA domain-containing protein
MNPMRDLKRVQIAAFTEGRIVWVMKTVVCAAFFFCAALGAAQDCTQTLPINVLDRKTGNAVTWLKPESLLARMGDSAVRIMAVGPVEHRRVLVLMDQSASMAPKDAVGTFQKEALEAVEDTMGELLQQLPAGTSVAYGFFNDTWVFTPEFLSDPTRLHDAIAETKSQLPKAGKGETSLFDALHEAMLRLGTPNAGDTIVVMTDTGENKSKLYPGKVEKELRESGIRLVLLLVQQHLPVELVPYQDTMTSLAENSGGAVETIDTADRSWLTRKNSEANREALRKFWTQEVMGGYLLRVQTAAGVAKPHKWSVRINQTASPELKGAVIRYPAKLAPCPVSTAAVH